MISQDDYEWLFRKAPVMTTSIAEDGAYLDVNDAMLRPALRRRGKLENKPVSFVTSSGEIVDCITNAFVEYDKAGKYLRTVAMYSELSDQARANFKYRDLYRATPAMLHTVDGDGLIITSRITG